MNFDEKIEQQAESYEWVDGYSGGPLEGTGRWAVFPDDTIIYTDDANILFAKNDRSTTVDLLTAVLTIRQLFKEGLSATTAFNKLTESERVISGDLSTIA